MISAKLNKMSLRCQEISLALNTDSEKQTREGKSKIKQGFLEILMNLSCLSILA
jgi:hypothetical protein